MMGYDCGRGHHILERKNKKYKERKQYLNKYKVKMLN
jgi:hypothetical protein